MDGYVFGVFKVVSFLIIGKWQGSPVVNVEALVKRWESNGPQGLGTCVIAVKQM